MEKLHTLVIFTTSRCTLNCKLCSAGIPLYRKHGICIDNTPEEILYTLSAFFNNGSVGRVDISGGEPLIWGTEKLITLLNGLSEYEYKYDLIRIITNGTVLPCDSIIDTVIKNPRISFVLDNYGKLSPKAEQLKQLLTYHGVNYQENIYHGDNQWCGGWTDIIGDLSYKYYNDEKLKSVFDSCHVHQELRFLVGNKIYPCSTAPLVENLLGVNLETEMTACKYCNGFDSESCIRYPAAEQI